ncbi:hypothetical protein ONK27_27430, partial [Salmonella enterica subsp. enterica serovar Virginia]|nr:hypothetical protein [Salmonella enterica subsp. enterica serovar Virginia]
KGLPALENPVVAEDEFARHQTFTWPLSATGTLFALGLNYADHLHSFLSLPPDNSYVRMRRLVLLEHISNLFRAIPFMTIDDDYP